MVGLHCTMCGHEYNQKLYQQDTVKNNIKLHDENKISYYYFKVTWDTLGSLVCIYLKCMQQVQ